MARRQPVCAPYFFCAKKILFRLKVCMRITRINNNNFNYKYKPVVFRGEKEENSQTNKPDESRKPIPDWARRTMLLSLVFFTVKNDPVVQRLFSSNELTQEEKEQIEFFRDLQNVRKEKGVSNAFYQLNQFYDLERPKIKALGNNSYAVDFELDDKNVSLEMRLDKNQKDTIRGRIKVDNGEYVRYKAVFPSDKKDNFKIIMQDDKKDTVVLEREYFGKLYLVQGKNKKLLNSKNVQNFEEYKERLEELDKWSFFKNENQFWRKANILLLIYLLYSEIKYERRRAKENQNNGEEV